jgi:HlyD family secretion protein
MEVEFMKKRMFVLVVILFIFTLFGLNIFENSKKAQKVETVKLTNKELSSTIKVPGTLKFKDEELIFYHPEKGEVKEIFVRKGEQIDQGTPLFVYNNESFDLEKEKLSVMIDSSYLKINDIAKKEEDLLEKEEELSKSLGGEEAKKQLASEKRQLKLEKRLANNDLKQLLLQKDMYEAREKGLEVNSGISGEVVSINKNVINQGENSSLIHIVDKSNFIISSTISEYDSIKIKEGQSVVITSDILPTESWKGKVDHVSLLPSPSESLQSEMVTYPIQISVEGDIPLKPGVQLSLEIEVSKKKTSALPLDTIIQKNNIQKVYVIKDGKASLQKVETGISSGSHIEILKGLKKNDEVMLNPASNIKEGQEVLNDD